MILRVLSVLLALCVPAEAGMDAPVLIDPSVYAKKTDLPTAADIIPPADSLASGTPGAIINQFRRPDAQAPRVSRSFSTTLNADGTKVLDWSAYGAMPAGSQVLITPRFDAQGWPTCKKTAPVTTTGTSIACAVTGSTSAVKLTLGNLTAAALTGLDLINLTTSNTVASGMAIDVIVLPPSTPQ